VSLGRGWLEGRAHGDAGCAERCPACPSSNAKYMPADVCDTLLSIFREEGGLSDPDAAAYLAQLQRTLRFQTETWA